MRISKIRIYGSTTEVFCVGRRKAGASCRVSDVGQAAASVALGLLCLSGAQAQETHGQDIQSPERAHAQGCPDPLPQTSGSHGFRREGETIDIPITVADCQPISFVLRWSNGRNNGSRLVVTFLDSTNQPIHSRSLFGFLTGSFEFPFASLDTAAVVCKGINGRHARNCRNPGTGTFCSTGNYLIYGNSQSSAHTIKTSSGGSTHSCAEFPACFRRGPLLDQQLALKLRTAEGRLLSQGQGSGSPRINPV